MLRPSKNITFWGCPTAALLDWRILIEVADAAAHPLVLVSYPCGLACWSSICLLDQTILDGIIRVNLLVQILNTSILSISLFDRHGGHGGHAEGALKLVPLHLDPLVQALILSTTVDIPVGWVFNQFEILGNRRDCVIGLCYTLCFVVVTYKSPCMHLKFDDSLDDSWVELQHLLGVTHD